MFTGQSKTVFSALFVDQQNLHPVKHLSCQTKKKTKTTTTTSRYLGESFSTSRAVWEELTGHPEPPTGLTTKALPVLEMGLHTSQPTAPSKEGIITLWCYLRFSTSKILQHGNSSCDNMLCEPIFTLLQFPPLFSFFSDCLQLRRKLITRYSLHTTHF